MIFLAKIAYKFEIPFSLLFRKATFSYSLNFLTSFLSSYATDQRVDVVTDIFDGICLKISKFPSPFSSEKLLCRNGINSEKSLFFCLTHWSCACKSASFYIYGKLGMQFYHHRRENTVHNLRNTAYSEIEWKFRRTKERNLLTNCAPKQIGGAFINLLKTKVS